MHYRYEATDGRVAECKVSFADDPTKKRRYTVTITDMPDTPHTRASFLFTEVATGFYKKHLRPMDLRKIAWICRLPTGQPGVDLDHLVEMEWTGTRFERATFTAIDQEEG